MCHHSLMPNARKVNYELANIVSKNINNCIIPYHSFQTISWHSPIPIKVGKPFYLLSPNKHVLNTKCCHLTFINFRNSGTNQAILSSAWKRTVSYWSRHGFLSHHPMALIGQLCNLFIIKTTHFLILLTSALKYVPLKCWQTVKDCSGNTC